MATQYSFPSLPERTPLHERSIVVGLVVLLHAAVFATYRMQPTSPAVLVSEMSVSFANMQMQQASVVPQPKPRHHERKPEAVPVPLVPPVIKEETLPTQKDAAEEVHSQQQSVTPAPSAQQKTAPAFPVLPDAEPDYRAAYLNNPRPPYPLVARRMGYHGKVVLDVEVLAEGSAGDVQLHQSSGYEILDHAAIQTVKTWRFTPARRLGQPVTQRFLVPIKFSLEDNAG